MQIFFVIVLIIIMFLSAVVAMTETETKALQDRGAAFFAACLVAILIMFLWG